MAVTQQSQPRGHQVMLLLAATLKTAALNFTKDQAVTSYFVLSNYKYGKNIYYLVSAGYIFFSVK